MAAGGAGSEAPARSHRSGKARFGSHEFLLGWVKARPGEIERSGVHLEANLQVLADKARGYGTRLIIMTYPSRFKPVYQTANRLIRQIAKGSGIELVDLELVFEDVCPDEECPEFLFPDHHPRARGYQVIAETLVEHFRRLLEGLGHVPPMKTGCQGANY